MHYALRTGAHEMRILVLSQKNFESALFTLIRHYFEPVKAMSPTTVGNRTLPRRPHRNPLRVMFRAVGACEQPARSGAHGFRSHRLRSLLSVRKFCRIRVSCARRGMTGAQLVKFFNPLL